MARQITYRCRDIGYGVEEGTTVGKWGDHQWAGSRHLIALDGTSDLYLFPDEVVEDVEVAGPEPLPAVVEVALTTDELHAVIEALDWWCLSESATTPAHRTALATLLCVLALAEHWGV